MYSEVLLTQPGSEKKPTLTYEIGESLQLRIGHIVEVPIRTRTAKGIIFRLHAEKPDFKTKPVLKIIENAPHLEPWQIELLQWLSEYYFCPLNKVLKLFLPVPFLKKKQIKNYLPEAMFKTEFETRRELNEEQKEALAKFAQTKKSCALLHGVTGSGKTEVYLHAADQKLQEGYQVLMLIPEISLTPQTVERFQDYFEQKIAIIHSQLTAKQKEQAWQSIHKGEARIIIGSRSALFAPFQKLGLIVIDEEHDASYKQDQSPRYHAFEVALQMAKLLNLKILAGSATPSLENYYRAEQGEFELIELKERVSIGSAPQPLPTTHIVDLREEMKKKNFSVLSDLLRSKIAEKLAGMEQVILFLNRRGAASAVFCRECGFIVKCPNCEVPMTYHNRVTIENLHFQSDRLICHHCGKIAKIPTVCPHCHSLSIRYLGLGTQRVEAEIMKIFSLAKILRADRDTIKQKGAFKKIYERFKDHEADVLIGTQMIALGLHLPDVNLVGIILADTGLMIPNFNSSEKTFQILTQVAGRAGRENKPGQVVIQTYLPQHYAIKYAAAHDYAGFYHEEIALRRHLGYPPFKKLIKLTISHKEIQKCEMIATELFDHLRRFDSEKKNVITSYPALIPKFQQKYRWNILITGDHPAQLLTKYFQKTAKPPDSKILRIDVDPLSTV